MSAKTPLTLDELKNNYEVKLAMRVAKKEFPFIKEFILPDQERLNEYNLIFLDLIINTKLMMKILGWELSESSEKWFDYHKDNPSVLYQSLFIGVPFKQSFQETSAIEEKINSVLRSIRTSPAFPRDMTLPHSRTLSTGNYQFTNPLISNNNVNNSSDI